MINAICNPANLSKVVKGVDEELARLLNNGISAEEFDRAKTGYLQQYQSQRANDGALLGLIANHVYLGRTMKYDADLEQAIQKLTPETVLAALRKHVDPKMLIVVGAGDQKAAKSAQ